MLEARPSAPDAEESSLESPAAASEAQTSTAAVADADEETTPPPPTTVDFQPLSLENPATSMAMTEDGRYLVLSHQTADQITIYDVLQRNVVATLTTTAPRAYSAAAKSVCLQCGSNGEGTISVFAHRDSWQQVNQLKVLKPNIVHLSAPGGENFRGELIVTCHGAGQEASYQDSHVFVVDTTTDKCRPIARTARCVRQLRRTAHHDARLVSTQPVGRLDRFQLCRVSLGQRQGTAHPARWGCANTICLSGRVGSYWIGSNVVFGGVPIAPELKKDLGKLIVPDLSQKVIYALTEHSLTAHRLDVALTDMGMREARIPSPLSSSTKAHQLVSRTRDYLLDHPVAYTHGDRLFLFVLTASGGHGACGRDTGVHGECSPCVCLRQPMWRRHRKHHPVARAIVS